jgi:4a-hydroxytetrahydrobiopterin dehydratase
MSWTLVNKKLFHRYEFNNFIEALTFVNKVGELAEEAQHHPDITFGWGYVEVYLYTHSKSAVTEADTNLAAKIDTI